MKKGIKKLTIVSSLFFVFLLGVGTPLSHGELGQRDITVNFCNDGKLTKKANLDLDPKEETDLCIHVYNISGEESGTVRLYFVDGFINPITPDNVSCRNEDDPKEGFGKFAKFEDGSSGISREITPNEQVKVNTKIQFPSSYVGYTYGCIITEVGEKKIEKGKLNFVIRKGNVITAHLKGNPVVELIDLGEGDTEFEDQKDTFIGEADVLVTENNFFALRDTKKIFLKKLYKNTGNVEVELQINATISDSFGYTNKKVTSINVPPLDVKEVSLSFDELPPYGMGYTIDVVESQKPIVPTIGGKEPEDMSWAKDAEKESSTTLTYYVAPSTGVIATTAGTGIGIVVVVVAATAVITGRRPKI